MPMKRNLAPYLEEVRRHLEHELLPYWRVRGDDPQYGGFLTCFDSRGAPTGDTDKNLLATCRMIFAFSAVHRAGRDPDGSFLERAGRGLRFLEEHFLDRECGGWYWILRREGTPLDRKKIIYGHSFVIYALSELYLASGDKKALELARHTFDLLQTHAADNLHGGYWEFFERDWEHCRPGEYGGDRKSLDVHMHLMEAFTNLYLASRDKLIQRRTTEIIELICSRMLHPSQGTGIAQFSADFTPQRALIFKNVWGSDRQAGDLEGRPLDNTSYGHNVELGWLLSRSVEVLGLDPGVYHGRIRSLYDHCLQYGLDWKLGGVYCEGPHAGAARERNKEFWQQAETLVALLDALAVFGDPRYLEAYDNVHRFVFDHVVNHAVGEWFPLLGPGNEVLWDYMGHQWKINYHTIRSMLECEKRLSALQEAMSGG
ncbi:MAG: N-acylglucosamine 2-epimerase [Candidatus Glassbacteria bacterium RIFCSPLOWO2_12_FULL_58_11]|uniref:N-acylglucosamine 2-epimerase n=1 Tax=Candidatus Glassbacteria bacterium RIFCSPLOWO2_12_FULL_58_11 TaxID=1817867 RepID=A0A1F5YLY7_9BACT|nr:MAG: N-acylglucosamine 2-epimerase [Candidatus Glassbacteria bacterium RIFCSPLOWO2_12_FULL_58_11]